MADKTTKPPKSSPADVAYERVREIALRFPEAGEKLSHGAPSFHVRGKLYLQFRDGHHGDGRIAVWCKSTHDEQRRLMGENPSRYFVPPYVGVRGWVGVDVDPANADWIELSILVEHAWSSVAPARVVRGESVGKPKAALPPRARVTTDADVARAALDRLTAIGQTLPEATVEGAGSYATFLVGKKAFAYFVDNHHGDGVIGVWMRGDKRENARLVATDPERYFVPAYVGSRGYFGIRLDTRRVDWNDVADRLGASYRSVAPKRLVVEPATSRRPK
jgi:hypothetical protein